MLPERESRPGGDRAASVSTATKTTSTVPPSTFATADLADPVDLAGGGA